MDMKKYYWFNLGSHHSTTQTISLGRSYSTKPHDRRHWSHDGTKLPMFEMLWRKLRKHKKNTTTMEGVYDPETYSKNFDQGVGSMEPENLCRSFSARFADPSRILPPKHLLDSWLRDVICIYYCFLRAYMINHISLDLWFLWFLVSSSYDRFIGGGIVYGIWLCDHNNERKRL